MNSNGRKMIFIKHNLYNRAKLNRGSIKFEQSTPFIPVTVQNVPPVYERSFKMDKTYFAQITLHNEVSEVTN